MAQLGVQIVGSAAGYKAALGESLAATERWAAETTGETVKVTEAFRGVSTAALQSAAAADKLAVAYARFGEGSLGAAAATVRYRKELEGLHTSSLGALQTVGRNLTTYVTLPMAAVAYEAVRMGVEFNRQMLLIQTQAGASASEVHRLSGQVLELAKSMPQSPVELAQGLYHLESIGLRGAKAIDTLRTAAIAAGMGIANLEDTATALGGVVVTGIKGAQNYQQAMATLTATVGAGNMRFEDLAAAIGSVAPAAAAAGVTLPELGAALATLTDRGFSADEAATRLRMSLALIQSPSEKAKKALRDLGINADSLGAMLRQPNGLLRVLETLNEAIQRVGAVRGNRDLLAGFGGGRSGLGIQTLVQSLNQSVSSYQQKLQDISAGQQKYGENVKTYMESPSRQLHSALSTLEADLIKIGQAFGPQLGRDAQAFAGAVDAIVSAFEKLPGPVKEAVGVMATGLALAGPIALGIVGVRRLLIALRDLFASLPLIAGPAAARTGTEVAEGVGAGVATAETEVATLRASLLGLGALAIAPIVIPVIYQYGKKAVTTDTTSRAGDLNPVWNGHQWVDPNTGKPVKDQAYWNRQFEQTHPGMRREHGQPAYGPALLPRNDHRLRRGHVGASGPVLNQPPPAGSGGGSGGSHPYTPSEAAQLNLALARNPDDVNAINAKLAYDERAAAFAEQRIREGHGSPSLVQQLESIYSDEQTLRTRLQELAKTEHKKQKKPSAPGSYEPPAGLRVQLAKAEAVGTPAEVQAALEAMKEATLRALHSGKLSLNAQEQAWNQLKELNDQLSQQVSSAGQAVVASAARLTANLHLSRAQRIQLEQRISQALAHGGHIPTAVGAGGGGSVHIHGPVHLHGVHDEDQLAAQMRQIARKGVVLRRGPNAGWNGPH